MNDRFHLGAWSVVKALLLIGGLFSLPFLFSEQVLQSDSSIVENLGGNRFIAFGSLIGISVARAAVIASIVFCSVIVCAFVIYYLLPSMIASWIEVFANGMRFTPATAYLPLAIAMFGVTSNKSLALMCMLGAGPLVLFNVLASLRAIPPEQLVSIRRKWPRFHVSLSASIKSIGDSLRACVGLCFVLCMVFEFLIPSTLGVARVVEISEILRHDMRDGILFCITLILLGILLDYAARLLPALVELRRAWRASAGANYFSGLDSNQRAK